MRHADASREHGRFVSEYCGPLISRYILEDTGIFIAGGSLVSFMDGDQVPRDIDIYVPNYSPNAFIGEIGRHLEPDYEVLSPEQSERYVGGRNCLYLRYNQGRGSETGMQFMFQPLCDPLNVLSGFDIELCKIALGGGALTLGRLFDHDFLERLINLDVVTNPLSTLERIQKYIRRGFNPSALTTRFMTTVPTERPTDAPPLEAAPLGHSSMTFRALDAAAGRPRASPSEEVDDSPEVAQNSEAGTVTGRTRRTRTWR